MITEDDPIYGAIARHTAARATYDATVSKWDFADEGEAELQASEGALEAAADALLDTRPTTGAGLAALLDYVRRQQRDDIVFHVALYRHLASSLMAISADNPAS